MIRIHTRVLNGLPVAVEGDYATDFDGQVLIEDITVYWDKPNKLGQYKRAKVIEDKLTHDDWYQLEDELLDSFFYHGVGYE